MKSLLLLVFGCFAASHAGIVSYQISPVLGKTVVGNSLANNFAYTTYLGHPSLTPFPHLIRGVPAYGYPVVGPSWPGLLSATPVLGHGPFYHLVPAGVEKIDPSMKPQEKPAEEGTELKPAEEEKPSDVENIDEPASESSPSDDSQPEENPQSDDSVSVSA